MEDRQPDFQTTNTTSLSCQYEEDNASFEFLGQLELSPSEGMPIGKNDFL